MIKIYADEQLDARSRYLQMKSLGEHIVASPVKDSLFGLGFRFRV